MFRAGRCAGGSHFNEPAMTRSLPARCEITELTQLARTQSPILVSCLVSLATAPGRTAQGRSRRGTVQLRRGGVGAGQPVEGAGMVRVRQVRDFVDEHRIENPLGTARRRCEMRSRSVVRARSPASRLVRYTDGDRGAARRRDSGHSARSPGPRRSSTSRGCSWVRSRSTSQSTVFCLESASRCAGTDTTIRLPTQRASDVRGVR